MGLTSYRRRHKLPSGVDFDLGVIGLKGSYHGDTIGAMDASEHSVYNAQVDWYKGKGLWLDAPHIHLVVSHQALIFTNPGDQWGPQDGRFRTPAFKQFTTSTRD
jgi:dethiobiotin synthetase/adenosylmethionine--8-amino-7-oxononanoate aminotransferase